MQPYYGINKCKPTEPSPTINQTSKSVIKKEAENIGKCEDLTKEKQCIWNAKTNVIPAVIRATGTFPSSSRK
jgi:hypothetical protein